MIQRYLIEVLNWGLQKVSDQPELLDDLFKINFLLKQDEVDQIKAYVVGRKIQVLNGYSMLDTKFPAVALIMGNESEDELFLADDVGSVDDPGSEYYHMDVDSAIWDYNFLFVVAAEHPDQATYYYEIVKMLLHMSRQTLINNYDLLTFKFSGADLMPDPRFMPAHAFVRQLSLTCKREYSLILRDSLLGKAFVLDGMHIDRSGSPRDPGNVNTLVYPYIKE